MGLAAHINGLVYLLHEDEVLSDLLPVSKKKESGFFSKLKDIFSE